MSNVKFLMSFVLVSFVTQGAFTSIQADPPVAAQAPNINPTDVAAKDISIPTLAECMDSKEPWGLNLNNVNTRQIRLRKAGKGGTPDAAKDIINLQQLIDRLQDSPAMEKENKDKILALKSQIQLKMVQSVNKKLNKNEKKKLTDEISQLNSDLQKENAALVMFKNPLYIKEQMETLKKGILVALKDHGLTPGQLDQLPSLKTWRANPASREIE